MGTLADDPEERPGGWRELGPGTRDRGAPCEEVLTAPVACATEGARREEARGRSRRWPRRVGRWVGMPSEGSADHGAAALGDEGVARAGATPSDAQTARARCGPCPHDRTGSADETAPGVGHPGGAGPAATGAAQASSQEPEDVVGRSKAVSVAEDAPFLAGSWKPAAVGRAMAQPCGEAIPVAVHGQQAISGRATQAQVCTGHVAIRAVTGGRKAARVLGARVWRTPWPRGAGRPCRGACCLPAGGKFAGKGLRSPAATLCPSDSAGGPGRGGGTAGRAPYCKGDAQGGQCPTGCPPRGREQGRKELVEPQAV